MCAGSRFSGSSLLAVGSASAAVDAVNKPLLGIAGQSDRFKTQTGQDSQVKHIFLGWEQGRQWGSPFSQHFASLKPIPMIHIGTDRGRARTEAITPAHHPGYYAAFVLDPDGTNVEAVYHGPFDRSAPSVVFTWED